MSNPPHRQPRGRVAPATTAREYNDTASVDRRAPGVWPSVAVVRGSTNAAGHPRFGEQRVDRRRRAALGALVSAPLWLPVATAQPGAPQTALAPAPREHRGDFRLPAATDLSVIQRETPPRAVLIAFFLSTCAFCHRVDREFLGVMYDHRDFRDRVVMRHVVFDRRTTLIDFSGETVSGRAFADRYGVRFAPTVIAFTDRGDPVDRPLVGIPNIEFYGAELERRIDAAVAQTRNGHAPTA